MPASPFIAELRAEVSNAIAHARETRFWQRLIRPETPADESRALLRELYREAFSYHRNVFEAALAIINCFPEPDLRTALAEHLAEEETHGEMAFQAYLKLGGDAEIVRGTRPSPGAFAVSAYWWALAAKEDPYCYLGAMYLLEASTPIFSAEILEVMARHGLPADSRGHAQEHVEVDARHAETLRRLIQAAVERTPSAAESILFGLRGFGAIYPGLIFDAALARASRSMQCNLSDAVESMSAAAITP